MGNLSPYESSKGNQADNQTWFDPTLVKDLMNVIENVQFIDPTFRHSCLVLSSEVI